MPADRSQTERIRQLRGKLQAIRRSECAACPEEGPLRGTDESTRLSRSLGQMTYYRQNANGAVVAESCCASLYVVSTSYSSVLTTGTCSNNNKRYVYQTFTSVLSQPVTNAFVQSFCIPSLGCTTVNRQIPTSSIQGNTITLLLDPTITGIVCTYEQNQVLTVNLLVDGQQIVASFDIPAFN